MSKDVVVISSAGSKLSNVIFWVVAFLLLFWALGDRGLWGAEDRWAEIVREMFLTGDFFHPAINGNPYFDKPLLGYWFIAMVSATIGSLNEWAVRLPSVISGLLGLWATVYLGRKLWSEEVGRMAGWLLLTTYGFIFWARLGEADMENLAAIILAVAWYCGRREKPNFLTYLVFYLIIFLGAQTKGLTAVIVPIIAILPDFVRERRWRVHLTPSHLLALIVGIAVYVAPFIYASMTGEGYQESGLYMAFRENIQRYLQPFDHKEPFYVYFYYIPRLLLPWTPLFLTALLGTVVFLRDIDRRTRWLLEAAILIFLFFTASGSRRTYYILPILPFCALFTAVFFKTEGKEAWKRVGLGLQGGLFGLVCLIEILSLAIWPLLKDRIGFVPPMDLRLITPVVGLLAIAPWILKRLYPDLSGKLTGINLKVAPLIVTAAILMGGFFCLQQQSLDVYRTERPFARELKAEIAGLSHKQIAFYRKVSPNELFYLDLRGPVLVLKDPDSVIHFLESGTGVKILVSRRKYLPELVPVLPLGLIEKPILKEKVNPWRKASRKLLAWKIGEHGASPGTASKAGRRNRKSAAKDGSETTGGSES